MITRSGGRRRSDFWKPVAVAAAAALITNLVQGIWQETTKADTRDYYVAYINGLATKLRGCSPTH